MKEITKPNPEVFLRHIIFPNQLSKKHLVESPVESFLRGSSCQQSIGRLPKSWKRRNPFCMAKGTSLPPKWAQQKWTQAQQVRSPTRGVRGVGSKTLRSPAGSLSAQAGRRRKRMSRAIRYGSRPVEAAFGFHSLARVKQNQPTYEHLQQGTS